MDGWEDGLIFLMIAKHKSVELLLSIVCEGVVLGTVIEMKRNVREERNNLILSCCTKLLLTLYFQTLLDHVLYCPRETIKCSFVFYCFYGPMWDNVTATVTETRD